MKLEKYYFCAECGQIIKKIRKIKCGPISVCSCPICRGPVRSLKFELESLLLENHKMDEE